MVILRRCVAFVIVGIGMSVCGNEEPVGECPVKNSDTKPAYNASANDMVFGNNRQPGQKIPLSTQRTVSSIQKSDFTPSHQPEGVDKWVYPSQQQYYNAMKRKGYNPNIEDVGVILAIHNIVNEKGWASVREWEALRGCSSPKLKRFVGRPGDVSPKAYLRALMGYSLPFDRHDWVVETCSGEEVRYVIDFYTGERGPRETAPISMHLDVRPALDSPYAFYYRAKRFVLQWSSGIDRFWTAGQDKNKDKGTIATEKGGGGGADKPSDHSK